MTHLHNFSPPAIASTSCHQRNSNLGHRFVFIFYLLASLFSLLGSLGLVYSADFKYFVLQWNCLCGCGDREMLIQLFFNTNPPLDPNSLPIALCKGKRTFTSHPISQFVSYGHFDHSVFGKFSEAVLKFGLRRCHSDHSVFSHTYTWGKILLIV